MAGLASWGLDKEYTFDGGAGDAELTEPIQGWSQKLKLPITNNTVVSIDPGSSGSYTSSSFNVDLTKAVDAKLSFDYSWSPPRILVGPCAGPPSIKVLLDVPSYGLYTLLGENDLLTTSSETPYGDWYANPHLTKVQAAFPEVAYGKQVTVIFHFSNHSGCTVYGADGCLMTFASKR